MPAFWCFVLVCFVLVCFVSGVFCVGVFWEEKWGGGGGGGKREKKKAWGEEKCCGGGGGEGRGGGGGDREGVRRREMAERKRRRVEKRNEWPPLNVCARRQGWVRCSKRSWRPVSLALQPHQTGAEPLPHKGRHTYTALLACLVYCWGAFGWPVVPVDSWVYNRPIMGGWVWNVWMLMHAFTVFVLLIYWFICLFGGLLLLLLLFFWSCWCWCW